MTAKAKVSGIEGAARHALWARRITEWERSGQTQKAFCLERGLAVATFQWWRARAKRRQAVTSAAPFLPMALGSMSALSVVEIELRSRTRIRFEGEAALRAVEHLAGRVK